MHKILMLILSGMASFAATAATTYYVAPNGYAGDAADDGNHGTREKPFATIAYAYPKLKTAGTNSELVLLSGTHLITSRIANAMLTYGIIRGETGDPKDVTLDFGNLADACLLVADIQLHDVTVINANADTSPAAGSCGGALRVQATMGTADSFPAFVSNCVFRACKSCAVAVSAPGQVLDCRFEGNVFPEASGKYKSLVYFSSDGNEKNAYGDRVIRGCTFSGNSSPGNGCCIAANCKWDPVVVDSCTFTDNVTSNSAADVYVGNSAVLLKSTFSNSLSVNNGGSVFMGSGADLAVTNCTFTACKSSGGRGGAIASVDNSAAEFIAADTLFSTNKAELTGGALYLHSVTGRLVRCSMIGNKSITQGGGGVRVGSYAKLTVHGCEFIGNVAATMGGVFYQDVSKNASVRSYGTLELVDSTFVENEALSSTVDNTRGGGVVSLGGADGEANIIAPLFVDRCVFRLNRTTSTGGVIYMRNGSNAPADCRVDIRNSLFEGNSAGHFAGAINLVAHNASVDNCTFITNVATKSGSNFYHRWTSYFRNCIFVSDIVDSDLNNAFCGQNANPQLYLNSIQVGRTDAKMLACFTADNSSTNLTMAEIGKLRFVDFANGDYSLNAGSIARNKGSTLDWMSDAAECLDLAGNARVYPKLADGGMVDIGCYECMLRNGLSLIIR